MSVNIHGKEYITVSERVQMAHELAQLTIETEAVRLDEDGVLFKAIVTTPKGKFVGHSYSSLKAAGIEGSSPVEVAETSAIGRALGFAGYGIVSGMATADEVNKSEKGLSKPQITTSEYKCVKCGLAITEKVYKYSTEVLGESLCFEDQKTVSEQPTVKQDLPF